MMAICHTAVPERTEGKITYQAASPGRSHLPEVETSLWKCADLVSSQWMLCLFFPGLVHDLWANRTKKKMKPLLNIELAAGRYS